CAAEGTEAGLLACTEILASALRASDRQALLVSLDQGLRDRPGPAAMQAMGSLFTKFAPAKTGKEAKKEVRFPAALTRELLLTWKDDTTDATLLHLLVHADH